MEPAVDTWVGLRRTMVKNDSILGSRRLDMFQRDRPTLRVVNNEV